MGKFGHISLTAATMLAASVLLAGCVPAAPRSSEAPQPSARPMFASDEEALAAATKAYAAYVEVSDQIFMDGGADANRLNQVSVGRQLEANLVGFREASQKGFLSTGGTHFDNVSLQFYRPNSPGGEGVIALYLCEDLTRVDVFDAEGVSVVSDNRPDRAGYQATFDIALSIPNQRLLLASRDPWPSLKC